MTADARELTVGDEFAILEWTLKHLQFDLRDEIVIDWFWFVVVVDL